MESCVNFSVTIDPRSQSDSTPAAESLRKSLLRYDAFASDPTVYAYADGNPIGYVDPLGLDPLEIIFWNAVQVPGSWLTFQPYYVVR